MEERENSISSPAVQAMRILNLTILFLGTAVTQWLRCCATNQKVVGSFPAGVIGIFHYGPGVGSASNRNEYKEHFLGVKAAGA